MSRSAHFVSGAIGLPTPGPERVENHRNMSMGAIETRMHQSVSAGDDAGTEHYAGMMEKREAYDKSNAARRETKRSDLHNSRTSNYESMVNTGEHPDDAYSKAFNVPIHRIHRERAISMLGGQGGSQSSFNSLSAQSHNDIVERHSLAAEDDTRGHMLTRGAEQRGIDPRSLWRSNESTARKHASPELKQWWDTHGRVTLGEHRADLLNPRGAEQMRQGREDFHR